MNYREAIEFLYSLRLFGAKLGLENTRRLAALAGNPQASLRFIHVAGTNGKGSVCAMLESIYREAGLKVGLFTSPHLVSFGERIQVNRRLMSEGEVAGLVEEMVPWLKTFPAGEHPTFFEVVTIMALCHFARQRCDLVVWETGLGGRLDATNIVTPLAGVITNVALDHQQWLGESLAQVAFEKAGIIKRGVPVLTAAADPCALGVIESKAREMGAPLFILKGKDLGKPPLDSIRLPLPGQHQLWNAALALATVRRLERVLPVADGAARRGLENVQWPGRLQRLASKPGQILLLDGAHNRAGFEALTAALGQSFPGQSPAVILGLLEDKDWAGIGRLIAPVAARICLVPVQNTRSAPPEQLEPACRNANPAVPIHVCSSFEEAWRRVEAESFVLVCGSLYLVGEAMEWLKITPAGGRDERGLNEWGRAPAPVVVPVPSP
jgi:dihydrofolate synthase / folylpolyglutamate synthase